MANMFRFRVGHLFNAGKQHEAMDLLHQALRYNPDNLEANDLLAKYFASPQKPKEAATYFRRVVQLKPEDPDARYNFAVAHRLRRNRRVATTITTASPSG